MIGIGNACFWINKIVPFIYQECRIIINPLNIIVAPPVLQICKYVPVIAKLLLQFCIKVEVRLIGWFIVILVIGWNSSILRPGNISIMFAVIFVPAAAKTYLGAFFFVLQGKDPAKKIIIQPTLPDQIGCRQSVGSYDGSAQAVIGIFLLGLI